MKTALIVVALVAGFLLASCKSHEGSGAGGSPAPSTVPSTEPVSAIDPQAGRILSSMCDLLESAKAMKFHASSETDERSSGGLIITAKRDADVLMCRPDCLVAHARGGAQRTMWYHGKTLTLLDGARKESASIEVPGTIDEMFDFLFEKYDLTLPLADLLFENPYETLTQKVQAGQYLGEDAVAGLACHHLLFEQGNVDWQVWIDAGEKPLPRKLVITYKNEPDSPAFAAHLDGWDLSPTVPADAFDAKVPSDVKNVDMSALLKQEGR
jgi:hypothetical protein